MATDSARRVVSVERTAPGKFTIVNNRGGRLVIGTRGDVDFSPTELLLAAIGGCTAIDVDTVTSRRAEPDSFNVSVDANKVRDDDGNRLTDIEVTFRIRFSRGAGRRPGAPPPARHRQEVTRSAVHGQPHDRAWDSDRNQDRVSLPTNGLVIGLYQTDVT